MATSFISERSAEYILTARLVGMLAPHYKKIVPLYFLLTREGSKISRECDPFQTVSTISVFARRPKVNAPKQPFVEVRFNESLFKIAALSESLGIPTYAGVPLASSVMDLGLDTDCIWFELVGEHGNVDYELSLQGELLSSKSSHIEGPFTDDELTRRIIKSSRFQPWSETVESLSVIRRGLGSRGSGWFGLGGGYHPFNLILWN